MIALLIVSAWFVIGLFLYYVVEPYFRCRLDMCLADDQVNRECARFFCSIAWPIAIFIHPFLRYALFPLYTCLSEFEKKVDAYWEKKPVKEISSPSINEAKTGYRNIEFKS